MNKMLVLCSAICMTFLAVSNLAACDSNKLYDSRDGKTYKTVTIGSQTWMAENLNYSDSVAAPGLVGRTFCYNNSIDSCAKYGRLYKWAAAMDSAGDFSAKSKGCGLQHCSGLQCYNDIKRCLPRLPVRGICPEGWHLPSKAEWDTLYAAIGSPYAMQAQGAWSNATDSSGFSALPAGYYSYSSKKSFFAIGECAYFWTYNEYNNARAYYWHIMRVLTPEIEFKAHYKDDGFSIRCVKDNPEANAKVNENKLHDVRDGKNYKIVTIGSQTWMAENLNYNDSIAAPGLVGRSSCPNNSIVDCAKYGRLYTWAAAMDSAGTFSSNGEGCGAYKICARQGPIRGICPEGWHLPSKAEWDSLYKFIGSSPYALQAQGEWPNATDASGFSALSTGNFFAKFWSATEDYKHDGAFAMELKENEAFSDVRGYGDGKALRHSIRCIKDGQ